MVNQPLLTPSTVPQLSPVMTPKWQIGSPGVTTNPGSDCNMRPPGKTLFTVTSGASTIDS